VCLGGSERCLRKRGPIGFVYGSKLPIAWTGGGSALKTRKQRMPGGPRLFKGEILTPERGQIEVSQVVLADHVLRRKGATINEKTNGKKLSRRLRKPMPNLARPALETDIRKKKIRSPAIDAGGTQKVDVIEE